MCLCADCGRSSPFLQSPHLLQPAQKRAELISLRAARRMNLINATDKPIWLSFFMWEWWYIGFERVLKYRPHGAEVLRADSVMRLCNISFGSYRG